MSTKLSISTSGPIMSALLLRGVIRAGGEKAGVKRAKDLEILGKNGVNFLTLIFATLHNIFGILIRDRVLYRFSSDTSPYVIRPSTKWSSYQHCND